MRCKYKSSMTKKKAFTLIELLIVIAIIGILFIVLVSKVDFATDKAKASGVQTDFRSFQVAFESVAKEHAGFNTFGWDTGDANGNHVRDSYDKGDTNQNGIQDPAEVWIGSKVYGENWENVFTLTNPDDLNDNSAFFNLETAINKNLDPRLHITIDSTTGKITMANGAQDPWKTEYHGYYLTNANTDGKDRGAIVMYSNGANQICGSEQMITNGVVSVWVPNDNIHGQDDYSMSTVYTYVNGFGEIITTTTGFSNNLTVNNNTGIDFGNNSLTIEQLQKIYEFTYYSSFEDAMSSSNGSTTNNSAKIGVYIDDNGIKNIVVIDHVELTTAITINENTILNLGGKTVTLSASGTFKITAGTVKVDGSLRGSKIEGENIVFSISGNSNVTVNGGQYSRDTAAPSSSYKPTFYIKDSAVVHVSDASISVKTVDAKAYAVCAAGSSNVKITNSNILANNNSDDCFGIYNGTSTVEVIDTTIKAFSVKGSSGNGTAGALNFGTATFTNCTVEAFTDYSDSSRSYGLRNAADGTMYVNNCNAKAAHSGLSTYGTLYVNGGIYESYGHGGIYFCGVNKTHYVKDAVLRTLTSLPYGYQDIGGGHNASAFYIGGSSSVTGVVVKMDNCTLYGEDQAFTLRGTDGESNLTLYISNSFVHNINGGEYLIRVDNNTHTIYMGAGNNFGANNTSKPERVIQTSDTYRFE